MIIVKKYKPVWIAIITLFYLCPYNGAAQTIETGTPLYRHFTNINSDLPSNVVYKIVSDHYGYLWMATERGMVRYDGSSFQKYTAPATDNEFIQVYKSADSLLWLFGYSGNCRLLNLNTHTFTSPLHEPNTPTYKSPVILAYKRADTLALYRANSIFSQTLLTDPKQYWLKRKETFISDLLLTWRISDNIDGISTNVLTSLFKSKPYAIQIAGDFLTLGNKIFQKKQGASASLLYDGNRGKVFNNISSFARIGNDLYLGFVEAQELLVIKNFYASNNRSQQISSKILSDIPVTSLSTDYQGNLWVGTLGKGVYLFTPADLASRHLITSSKDSKGLDYISGISRLDNGFLALGHDKDKVSILSHQKMMEIYVDRQQSLNEIRSVYKVKNNWFFFGSQRSYTAKGAQLPGKILPMSVSTQTPFKDGIAFGGKYYFTTKTACFIINADGNISVDDRYTGNNTLSIAPFNDSTCFYGTNDGIYRNKIKQPVLSSFRINKIRIINGYLVVCTQQGAFVIPINKQGELGNAVKISEQICYDVKSDSQYCYFRTGSGLAMFNLHNWKLYNEINSRKYAYAITDFLIERDTLIFATDKGIVQLPKAYITSLKNAIVPKLYIASSLTGYDPSRNTSEIVFSEKLSATLTVNVLDYSNEVRESSYQINYDGDVLSNWQVINNATVALNNLKPGKYMVTVKTEGRYSGIQSSAVHTIIVRPLWYQERWVQALVLALLVLAISFILFRLYRFQLHKARKKMNDQLRMNELESKNLFAQLKPHFIFNVLTPLQSYFINGDDIGGLKYIDNYAKLMRGFLQESRESYISIAKEVDFLKHYLFIQQRRFNNSFTYSFEIDPFLNCSKYAIPTLLLQPIVENAIEHGLNKNGKTDGAVLVKIDLDGNKIKVSVMDNGIGLKPGETFLKSNHAIEIIKERLELIRIKHKTGMFNIRSNCTAPGTTVILELPLLTTQP